MGPTLIRKENQKLIKTDLSFQRICSKLIFNKSKTAKLFPKFLLEISPQKSLFIIIIITRLYHVTPTIKSWEGGGFITLNIN